MAAGSIIIDLLMKTGMFETDTKRAEKALENFQKKAKQVGTVVGTAMAAAAAAVAVWTKQTIDAAAEVDRLSMLANTSHDTFQRWAAGASMVGIQQEKLADILKDTQDKVGDFIQTGGGAMADFFEQIAPRVGVTAEQFRKLSGPQALQLYVSSLEKANLSQSDMIFYMEAIASDSSLLLPLLRNNAEAMDEYGDMAERLGAVMSDEVIANAALAREELNKLNLVKQGLINKIVEGVLPSLTNMTARLVDSAEKTNGLDKAARVAVTGMKLLTSAGLIVAGVFKTVGEFLGGAAAAIVEFLSGNFRQAFQLSADVRADFVGNVKGMVDDVKAVWDDAPIQGTPMADAADRDTRLATRIVKENGKKVVDEAIRIWKRVEEAIARIGNEIATFGMTDDQKLIFDLQLQGADEEQIARATAMVKVLRDLKDAEEARKEAAEQEKTARGVLDDLNLEIEALGKSNEWIAKRNALLQAGVTAESDLGKAIVTTVEELYRQGEAIDKQVALMDTFRSEASNALADVLLGTKSLKDGFLDMLDAINARIMRMIADNLMEQLFGQMGTNQSGSAGGWFSSLMGMFFGGAKAGGGDALPGRAHLIGEQGPELFVPRTAGTVIPAAATAALMGGVGRRTTQVTQNFINPVLADRRSDSQRAAESARRIREAQRNS